jgi:hypothetical protein
MGKKQYRTGSFHPPVENLFDHYFTLEKLTKTMSHYPEVYYLYPDQKAGKYEHGWIGYDREHHPKIDDL